MNYILRYITRSKYLGHVRINYKEFDNYKEAYEFIDNNKLRSCEYEIYGKVIL